VNHGFVDALDKRKAHDPLAADRDEETDGSLKDDEAVV